MTPQEESIKRRTFAILWDKARDDRHRSLSAESSMVWLKAEGWPLLFPGHCFSCHMNEHDPCDKHLSCPACVKESVTGLGVLDPCAHCAHSRSVHGKSGCHITYPSECTCAGFNEPTKPPEIIEPCEQCGCARILHRVNVGGERTGCFNHLTCDEWVPEIEADRYNHYVASDCIGGDCGCPNGAHE